MSEIKTVAIVGAGTMGQGIAIACALAGYPTVLFDTNRERVGDAVQSIRNSLMQSLKKGKLSEGEVDKSIRLIRTANDLNEVKADLIMEAIVEKMDLKQALFVELEKINSRQTIFVSNTSSLSISQIASSLQFPSRMAGLHFFNPAHLMKLVEVVAGAATNQDVITQIIHFSECLGKNPVEVKDSPGFIVNRVARHYYVESLKLLEEEVADVREIDTLLRSAGFKMGPFELMDLIGIDVNYAVTDSLYEGFNRDPRFKPSAIQKDKIEQGLLGRKTGKGFYDYPKD